MSLNFDVSKCNKNGKNVAWDHFDKLPSGMTEVEAAQSGIRKEPKGSGYYRERPQFTAVMHLAMVVMPKPGWEISEKNIEAFIKRAMIYQDICGGMMRHWNEEKKEFEDEFLKPQEIREFVGMKINISTISDGDFKKMIFKEIGHRCERLLEKFDLKPQPQEVGAA